MLMKLT